MWPLQIYGARARAGTIYIFYLVDAPAWVEARYKKLNSAL